MTAIRSQYRTVWILASLLSSIGLCTDDYYCWEESERVVLKFANNESKPMTQLPTVRLIQGFYASQFAMQYAAFIYLKEKMGVDVEFYPENNPYALWNRYSGYPGWCEYLDPDNTSNVTCSNYPPYPEFYFEDIGNDHYDLLFEIWDIIGVRGGMYIEEDIITNGGMSGVFGEGGWFIPKYMYQDHPDWILPHNLKYNESLRQIFIDAYTINSDRNYIQRWWDGMAGGIDDYIANGFGVPNYSQPIVWGSSPGYEISTHSNDLVNNLLGGINWTFASFGSEGNLTAFVKDLYAKELPFIASLYSPHEDFAITLPNATEYMQFERIALPRNPDNNPTHPCYEAGQCTFPLSPLLKMGNPRLLAEFEEMERFLSEFRMSTDDVNYIMGYHGETASYNLSPHERWINATCRWLKEAEETTNEWHQNITRYDCIFNDIEESGCGFDYYYPSFDDAVKETNAVAIAYDDSIAGSCSYNTYEPLCSCVNDYFTGSTCRGSCPAVIGPILTNNNNNNNNNNESYVVAIGNYTFYLCSGNGNCDIRTKNCNCKPGYGGDGCEIVFEVFKYQTSYMVLWLVLFGFVIVLLIVSGFWVYKNKHYKTIRALSPNLTLLFTFGLILLCIGTVLYIFHPMRDGLCSARIFFHGIGAILTIMAPLCKTYRVAIIFAQSKNLKRIVLPDKKLMVYIIYGVVMETIICVIYTIFHQVNGGVEKIYLAEYERIEYKCNTAETSSYIYAANYLYIFTLIIILCFFSFKNRATHKVFKESRCAFFGSFFSLFVFLVVFIFNLVVIDINVIIPIQLGAMFISICVIWGLFYGVRMYAFFMFPEERSIVTITPSNRSTRRDTTQVSVWEPSSRVSSGSEHPDASVANKSNTSQNKRGSQGMPSYINELYDQRGMQSPANKKTEIKLIPPASDKKEPAMIHPQNNKITPATDKEQLLEQ